VKGLFITGTDTGIGKTRATLHLMKALQANGASVLGLKPVATGACRRDGRWVNADALALWGESSICLPYEAVNPYCFEPPASPHLAAALAGTTIPVPELAAHCLRAAEFADMTLVEGAGGWRVPLNERQSIADLAKALDFPVIMVVGLRLGCINHALLTEGAIRMTGCSMAGWIANRIDDQFVYADASIQTLEDAFGVPPLAIMPYKPGPDVPGNGEFRELAESAILRAWAPCDRVA
jgi:dethiobiotin synthetase